MADALHEELAERMGSPLEASWVIEDLEGLAPPELRSRALEIAERRRAGEPLQYLLGHWPFRTIDLALDGRALIPRPETELLVELALGVLAERRGPVVACDLGCGSGAIALSIAVESAAAGRIVEVHASDVSEAALDLARANADRVGATGVTFHWGSWFEALPDALRGRFGIVCANPPYVSDAERRTLARELDAEPELALTSADGTDGTPGFAAVEAVLTGAVRWLAPGATVLVEHGESQRDAAIACARASGLVDVTDYDDLAARPRILAARRAQ